MLHIIFPCIHRIRTQLTAVTVDFYHLTGFLIISPELSLLYKANTGSGIIRMKFYILRTDAKINLIATDTCGRSLKNLLHGTVIFQQIHAVSARTYAKILVYIVIRSTAILICRRDHTGNVHGAVRLRHFLHIDHRLPDLCDIQFSPCNLTETVFNGNALQRRIIGRCIRFQISSNRITVCLFNRFLMKITGKRNTAQCIAVALFLKTGIII